MKNTLFVSALACLLLLSSCGSIGFNDNLAKVVEGMSQNEVNELLGLPTHRRFNQGIEEWEYMRAFSQENSRIVLIGFTDGRVTSMDSFLAPIPKTPQERREGKPHDRGKNPRQ